MKISGSQNEIKEIFYKLDPTYILSFSCGCRNSTCQEDVPELLDLGYCCKYESYEVDYDGDKLRNVKMTYRDYGSHNLLTGCVK